MLLESVPQFSCAYFKRTSIGLFVCGVACCQQHGLHVCECECVVSYIHPPQEGVRGGDQISVW
jgi:hypothetical protein